MQTFRWVILLPLLGLVIACQADQKSPDSGTIAQVDLSSQSAAAESSEGVVGPDEAFFAENYLEQVFHYSLANPNPNISGVSAFMAADNAVGAFDFAANFSSKRLRLMTRAIFKQGDLDRDNLLGEGEFSQLKLDPALFGVRGDILSHALSVQFWRQFAGEDRQLNEAELGNLLKAMGPAVKLALGLTQSHRLTLLKAWGLVLTRYDADSNGQLSLEEQRQLRLDRASLSE